MKNFTLSLVLLFFGFQANSQENLIQQNYIEYHDGVDQIRTTWVWNTKTGKSARYYYFDKQWKKSAVALPANPLGEGSTEVGEIMMNYIEYHDGEDQIRTVWVWNTKTGKSARYYYFDKQWKKSTVALPDNPLGEPSSNVGEIMMNYIEYHDGEDQIRTVWVCNTKTGKSARYYYFDKQWKKSAVALPVNALD